MATPAVKGAAPQAAAGERPQSSVRPGEAERLRPPVLPSEAELRAFASAAAQLLIEQRPHTAGVRTVSRRAGVGLQHLDHRDYQPGDEVRHIDWRQTARRRQPTLRRFEAESMADWTVVLDVSSSMVVPGAWASTAPASHPATKWQTAICLAAAMSYALLHLGHRVGLLAFGQQLRAQCPRGRGQHHYAALARLLGTLQPAPSGERSELGVCARHLQGQGAASVLVISDFLAAGEMGQDLTALLQRCRALHALQVSDASETQGCLTPKISTTTDVLVDLVDVETGAHQPVLASLQAEQQAAAERAAMTQRLRSFCARSGVPFTDGDVRTPWQHTLLSHLVRARRLC